LKDGDGASNERFVFSKTRGGGGGGGSGGVAVGNEKNQWAPCVVQLTRLADGLKGLNCAPEVWPGMIDRRHERFIKSSRASSVAARRDSWPPLQT
jgi:hypothetical protein